MGMERVYVMERSAIRMMAHRAEACVFFSPNINPPVRVEKAASAFCGEEDFQLSLPFTMTFLASKHRISVSHILGIEDVKPGVFGGKSAGKGFDAFRTLGLC